MAKSLLNLQFCRGYDQIFFKKFANINEKPK